MKFNFYFLLLGVFISTTSCGQHVKTLGDGESPAASIEDLSWIAGSWKGEAFGGETEEVWTAPTAGTMMGMFKLVSDSDISFYELMTISQEGPTLLLRIKHFNKDLTGWEEKDESVEFPLVTIKNNTIYFDGLTFKSISENQMNVYVNIEGEEVEFVYMKEK